MVDFIYNAYTKVYFGRGKEKEVGKIITQYGYKKIMMQYGKESIKKSGLYDVVMNSLKENNIEVVEMGGVEPNPKLDFVRKATEVAKKEKVELILAVGGGSVIDSCKATAVAAANNCDVWDVISRKIKPKTSIPVASILTISAAGSEMSNSAVITNMEENMKRGFNGEYNRCKFSICNPELTFTVSKYQTACGVVDIMAHTLERYFTPYPPTELTDRLSEGLMKAVVSAGAVAVEKPDDYDARANLMWASSISHNGLTDCGREYYLCVHQIEHGLSGEFDFVPHGAGLAVLLPAWGKYMYKNDPSRFAGFARGVFDVAEDDDMECARKGVEKMAQFFSSIGMPKSIREFGIKEESLERIAYLTTFGKTRTIQSLIELDYDKVLEILKIAY